MTRTKYWYHPETTNTGWNKDLKQKTRINKMVKAQGGDKLAAARALQSLANVTEDKETEKKARSDAFILFARHNRETRTQRVSGKTPQISGKMPKLR